MRIKVHSINPNDPYVCRETLARIDGLVLGYRLALGLPEPSYGEMKEVDEDELPEVRTKHMTHFESNIYSTFGSE